METKLINLTKNLIKIKSITPVDNGAIDLLKKSLPLWVLIIKNFYLNLKIKQMC